MTTQALNRPVDVLAIDFEQYAAKRGLSFAEVGDAGAHKRGRNQSNKQWARLVRPIHQRAEEVVAKREELRREYDDACARGEIRPLTRHERLLLAASGHPDLESTQAAQRLLAKKDAIGSAK